MSDVENKPTIYVLTHPTRRAVDRALLSLLDTRGEADTSIMQMINDYLRNVTDDPKEFAEYMVAIWSVIMGEPSWRISRILDLQPEMQKEIPFWYAQIQMRLLELKSTLIMASPRVVEHLSERGANIVFMELDTTQISNDELYVCVPNHFDGVAGVWNKYANTRDSLGEVRVL